MKATNVLEQVEVLFSSASQDLLAGMNCDVSIVDDADYEMIDAPVATIDAGSQDLEIQIALEMPMSVLALTYPVPNISVVDDASLEDWISELSNQLIGRLKSKLLKHEQEVTLGLPGSYFGVDIDDLMSSDSHRYTVYLNVDGQVCAFHVAIEALAGDINFSDAEVDSDDALMESEIELF
jgi:chemotaxis protein CheX